MAERKKEKREFPRPERATWFFLIGGQAVIDSDGDAGPETRWDTYDMTPADIRTRQALLETLGYSNERLVDDGNYYGDPLNFKLYEILEDAADNDHGFYDEPEAKEEPENKAGPEEEGKTAGSEAEDEDDWDEEEEEEPEPFRCGDCAEWIKHVTDDYYETVIRPVPAEWLDEPTPGADRFSRAAEESQEYFSDEDPALLDALGIETGDAEEDIYHKGICPYVGSSIDDANRIAARHEAVFRFEHYVEKLSEQKRSTPW